MRFNEILEKFKDGTATNEEREYINSEIEKNEAINSFLSEQAFSDLSLDDFEIKESLKVNKKIQNKFKRFTIITIMLTLSVLVSLQYVVFPIYHSIFYNPNTAVEGTNITNEQFSIDMGIYTELHTPGYISDYSDARSLGFGKYEVEVVLFNSLGGFTFLGEIDKGKFSRYPSELKIYDQKNIFYDMSGRFAYVENDGERRNNQLESEKNAYLEHLSELPTTSKVSSFFSFKEELSMDEIVKLIDEESKVSIDWIAVRTNKSKHEKLHIGFNPKGYGLLRNKDLLPIDKYPVYELGNEKRPYNKKSYEDHFKTLLKYMSTRNEFLTLLNYITISNDTYSGYYDEVYKYVNENGVNSYGVLVVGSPQEIIDFSKNHNINSIVIDDVIISTYSK